MHSFPFVEGVQHRFVTVGDLTLHYAEAGKGDPVILLHGWPQHWYMWHRQIAALAQKYRVICPDLRGFGWSDAPNHGYEKEQLATDVIALLDAVGVRQFQLMAHDWGGWVGFLICLRYPERVKRFLALNIAHPFQRHDGRLLHAWRFWYQLLISAPWLGYLLIRGSWFVHCLMRLGVVTKAWTEAELRIYSDVLKQPSRAKASVLLYRSFLLYEFLPVASGRYRKVRLRTPTLLLFGEQDFAISTRLLNGYEPFCDHLSVELVPACGHFIVDEQPNLVSDRASRFFT